MDAWRSLAGWLRPHQDILQFCFRFFLYSVLGFAALFALQDPVVEPFTRSIAWVTYGLMRAVGAQAWVDGVTVGIGTFSVLIRNNCNAIYEMALYAAASLAYPATARQRATGILFAVALLYVVNLVRVMSLIYVGYRLPGFFDAAHVYVWQVLFLVTAAALWLGWVGRIRPVA